MFIFLFAIQEVSQLYCSCFFSSYFLSRYFYDVKNQELCLPLWGENQGWPPDKEHELMLKFSAIYAFLLEKNQGSTSDYSWN